MKNVGLRICPILPEKSGKRQTRLLRERENFENWTNRHQNPKSESRRLDWQWDSVVEFAISDLRRRIRPISKFPLPGQDVVKSPQKLHGFESPTRRDHDKFLS